MGSGTAVHSARSVRSLRRLALVIPAAALTLWVSGISPHWAESAAAVWAGTAPDPQPLVVTQQPLGDVAGLLDIACPVADRCYALGDGSEGPVMMISDRGMAGPAQQLDYLFFEERSACPAVDTCFAVGRGVSGPGLVGVFVGLTPSQPAAGQTVAGTSSLNGVACPSSMNCYAVGVASNGGSAQAIAVPLFGATPGDIEQVSGAAQLNDIACPTVETCYAVGETSAPDSQGVVVALDSGVPGIAEPVPQTSALSAIGCAGADSCYAVGIETTTASDGAVNQRAVAVPLTAGAPGAPFTIADDSMTASGISCAPDGSCVATGAAFPLGAGTGWVARIVNGQSSPAQPVGGTAYLGGVACPTAAVCYSVGGTKVPAAQGNGVFATVSSHTAGTNP